MAVEINKSGKVAVLVGSTGLVGRHCLDFLLKHNAYNKVITIARKNIIPSVDKHEHIQVDFDKLESIYHQFSGDDLYLCLGSTLKDAGSKKKFIQVDFTYNLTLAKMAEKKQFNQLLTVSSVGASRDSLFFYSKVKGYLEDEIKKLDFWGIHIFRPSVLLGERQTQRFGEQTAGRLGNFFDKLTGGALTKYKPVEAEVVAKAMIHAAQQFNDGTHIYPSDVLQKLSEEYYQNKNITRK